MLQQGAAIFAVKVQSTTRHHRDRIAGVALLRKHASTTAAGGAQPTVRRCLGTQKHGWCARGGGHIRVPHAFWMGSERLPNGCARSHSVAVMGSCLCRDGRHASCNLG